MFISDAPSGTTCPCSCSLISASVSFPISSKVVFLLQCKAQLVEGCQTMQHELHSVGTGDIRSMITRRHRPCYSQDWCCTPDTLELLCGLIVCANQQFGLWPISTMAKPHQRCHAQYPDTSVFSVKTSGWRCMKITNTLHQGASIVFRGHASSWVTKPKPITRANCLR